MTHSRSQAHRPHARRKFVSRLMVVLLVVSTTAVSLVGKSAARHASGGGGDHRAAPALYVTPERVYRPFSAEGLLALPGPTPTPSPAAPLTISPKQGQQGKTYSITIISNNCEALNFQRDGYTILKEENSGIKISSDDNTVDGGCTYTAQLTVETNAPFGDVFIKLKPASGATLTVPFSIAAVAPGPVPPGIEPQVDVMWSVVPKNVVSDNFGKRVGSNFYCIEIVIGNSTGYDIQLASVGFKVGPIGPYATVAADTRKQLAAMALQSNELAIKDIVAKAITAREQVEKCNKKDPRDCSSEQISKNLEEEIQRITDRALTGQLAGAAAAKQQANILSELSQQAYSQKIPVSSYRMSRGSVEHGQFWSRRSLILNFVKAAGPFLTGFTPFFHALNHRNNFSQGINIFSDPFEKGIELVFPDETIRQLQRLDEQMLRDGLTILNNQQVRTRAFIPKKLLGLEGKLKDDWPTVTQALGTLILIGDKIQYINRIQVTALPSTEVKPPPTIQNIAEIFLIGEPVSPITITGQNIDQVQVTSNDKDVTPSLEPISNTTAKLTVTLAPGTKPGPKNLVFDSPTGSVIKTIMVDYPVATIDLAKSTIPQATFSPTNANEYDLHVEGTNLFRATIRVLPTSPANSIQVGVPDISEDGKALDAKITVPEGTPIGSYELELTTPTLAKNKAQPPPLRFTIIPQPPPSVGELTYDPEEPTAGPDQQTVTITLTGENLDGAKITAPAGFTVDDDAKTGKNPDPEKLVARITIAGGTKGNSTPFTFTLSNSNATKKTFQFKLNPQPTPAPTPTPPGEGARH